LCIRGDDCPQAEGVELHGCRVGPVVAVTAWQMLFEFARVSAGQTILVHGAAGNVGAYAVQLARNAGLHVIAAAASRDVEYVRSLGADKVLDYHSMRFEENVPLVDAIIDTVGGDVRERSLRVLSPTGVLVSVASPIPESISRLYGPRAIFFLVEVTTTRLDALSALFEAGKLKTQVGTVLPLSEAQTAHEMLAGAPHKRGKIVLDTAA